MPLYIYGLGTATPAMSITQDHAAQAAEPFACDSDAQRRQLRALYRLTRVGTRHTVILDSDSRDGVPAQSFFPPRRDCDDLGPGTAARMALYEREAPRLAVVAARRALDEAGFPAGEITHVVTVSCTGFRAPGVDIALMRELGLRPNVERTNVGFMGCHGALNGLRVARAFADSQPGARVLVCAVELCSPHFQYGWDPEQLVANALFADGAAAVVGGGEPLGNIDQWRHVASGAALLEDSEDLMSWGVGDHGFRMTLSARVPNVIEQRLRPWLDDWLAASGLSVGAIATWALHPGGPRILESCARTIGIDSDAYAGVPGRAS